MYLILIFSTSFEITTSCSSRKLAQSDISQPLLYIDNRLISFNVEILTGLIGIYVGLLIRLIRITIGLLSGLHGKNIPSYWLLIGLICIIWLFTCRGSSRRMNVTTFFKRLISSDVFSNEYYFAYRTAYIEYN